MNINLEDALDALLGKPERDKQRHPRRRDFDVPLPANCSAWLARITAKHRGEDES